MRMKLTPSSFLNVGLVSFLVVAMFLMPVTSEQSVHDYDPWADMDDNGIIDIRDISYGARKFGSEGDPTKNVNVMNWPTSEPITVWWYEPLLPGAKWSDYYNASGFGHLHIQMMGVNMEGDETITVRVHGKLLTTSIEAYSVTLTIGASSAASVTIPVPNEEFRFSAYLSGSGSPSANIYLGFYLTWA